MMTDTQDFEVVIVGAGPAGLTAAYDLCHAAINCIVLEKDQVVGGLARTVTHKGYRFDIGGHRFFTKIDAIENMWSELLGRDLLICKRLSHIHYDGKLFSYPLSVPNVLQGLGLWQSVRIFLSYLYAQIAPQKPEETFENWVSNRFGSRLYNIFFKSYTEKVWGMPCHEISADWAAQRIKGLSLSTAIKDAIFKSSSREKKSAIRTLIGEFYYPKLGPGSMWEAVAEYIQQNGGHLRLGTEVTKIIHDGNIVKGLEVRANSCNWWIGGSQFISSMPLHDLVQRIEPALPSRVLQASSSLRYRDFLTVGLVLNQRSVFPGQWIYIHDPDVKVGRIQNYKNWSQHMVPDPDKTTLGMEYFCFEGDDLWSMPDAKLIELAIQELESLSLVREAAVETSIVIRMPKAYPVYDANYKRSLEIIRQSIGALANLQTVGRNGMHKYNNQDHSMFTAGLAVKNILDGNYDLWQVNADRAFHEEINVDMERISDEVGLPASSQPNVPGKA